MREWLKELRKECGKTQKEMGAALGWTEGYFCLIEQGQRKKCLDASTLAKIAEATGAEFTTLCIKELGWRRQA